MLRVEKSLLVLIPLGVLISFLSLPFSTGASDVSPSAGFAGSSARGTLVFLLGVIVFYAGEAMHRDREVKVEPGLWSTPAPDSVFLVSKFLATLLLAMGLLLLIGLTAMLTQYLRGELPTELRAYLLTYGVIVIPSLVFIGATSTALNVLLREKYLTYVVIIAVSSDCFISTRRVMTTGSTIRSWFSSGIIQALPDQIESGFSGIEPTCLGCQRCSCCWHIWLIQGGHAGADEW